nr:serine/threonine/dual specificity protein kinase, catalytic domain-containing protein [Tanacetum cinerariifolium]
MTVSRGIHPSHPRWIDDLYTKKTIVRVNVAIKRSNLDSNQGTSEFSAEIEMLSMFRHRHIVSLLGYYEDSSTCEMILVYEYMPNESLHQHLHKIKANRRNSSPLTWVQRPNICICFAHALDYLYTGTGVKIRVIHHDVKSSNVLLDEKLTAKIFDFGVSRIGPANQLGTTNVYTGLIRGTFGYMDVEYLSTHRLTKKSDVSVSPDTSLCGVSKAWSLSCKVGMCRDESRYMVKEYKEKDKIGSKPDKNRKRGEAGKSQEQSQSIKEEKLNKTQKEGPKMQTQLKSIKVLKKKEKKEGLNCIFLKVQVTYFPANLHSTTSSTLHFTPPLSHDSPSSSPLHPSTNKHPGAINEQKRQAEEETRSMVVVV